MKYDMQIVVPIIPERLEGFQKYGVYKINDKKILLHCLIGTHKREQYEKGWPENLTVDIIGSESNNPIIQIYDFLSKLTPKDIVADWFAKIDDDAFNDFEKLINHFNKIYDPEKEFYIVTEVRHEMENCEIEILKKINVWEDEIDRKFTHELEACWFSKKAIIKILENRKCIELFKERSKIQSGYTDQCMGAAAKLCKIYPIEDYCCSANEWELFQCSLFNNFLYHFHPVCKLKNPLNYELILNLVENKQNNQELLKKIIDKKFIFIVKENNEEINSVPLIFLKNNILKSSSNEFKFYFIKNNDLIIARITSFIQYYIFKNFDFKEGRSPDEPHFIFELYQYT